MSALSRSIVEVVYLSLFLKKSKLLHNIAFARLIPFKAFDHQLIISVLKMGSGQAFCLSVLLVFTDDG